MVYCGLKKNEINIFRVKKNEEIKSCSTFDVSYCWISP